jgi:hypothetical protein
MHSTRLTDTQNCVKNGTYHLQQTLMAINPQLLATHQTSTSEQAICTQHTNIYNTFLVTNTEKKMDAEKVLISVVSS